MYWSVFRHTMDGKKPINTFTLQNYNDFQENKKNFTLLT